MKKHETTAVADKPEHATTAVVDKTVSSFEADLTAIDRQIADLKAKHQALNPKITAALVEAQKASATLRDKINPPNSPTLADLQEPTRALNHQIQIVPVPTQAESKKALEDIQAASLALLGEVGD